MIPSITTTEGKPSQAMPLIAVVLVSMIKDAYEDYVKAKNDRVENEGNKSLCYNKKSEKFEKT